MDIFAVVRRNPVVVALACAAALAMGLISEVSYRRSVDALAEISSSVVARASLLALQQSILDAEVRQRAFLFTGRPEQLEPYRLALRDIDEAFAFLTRYYGQDPHASAVLDRLRASTAARLADIAATISKHERGLGGADAGNVFSDIDRQKMDAIRALSAELLALEAASITAGQSELDRTLLIGRIGVAVLSAISLLALYLYLRQTHALEEQRRQQRQLVRAEHDRLEIEVVHRTAQLTELTQHLQTAREDERNRLARDLHDELGALLTSAKLDAARIRSRLAGTAPEALERLTHLVATLDTVIALKRRITEDLRPSALDHLGLVATLDILAREFAESSGIKVHCSFAPARLAASAELVVYRLVQEALTNLGKYARASLVWIDLADEGDQAVVSVRDDGVGFDSGAKTGSAFGLMGMRYRVEAEGGTLVVQSAPGDGTLVRATFPQVPIAGG